MLLDCDYPVFSVHNTAHFAVTQVFFFLSGQKCWKSGCNWTGISWIVSESIGSRQGSQVQMWFGMLQQLQERRSRVKGGWSKAVRVYGRDSNRARRSVNLGGWKRRKKMGSDSKWAALRSSSAVKCLYWNRKRKWILMADHVGDYASFSRLFFFYFT